MDKTDLNKKVKKQPGEAPPPVVIQKVDVRPVHRTTQDIPKWRNALQSAEARTPRRSQLYDLYADVILDAHVEAVTSKRFDATATANWQFVDKEGKPVDEINELIDTIGFETIVKEIINSKFWGYSIFEPTFWKNSSDKWEVSANLLPRINYRPEIGVVAYQATGEEGENIREGIYAKTIMEVGETNDLGLLVKAAQYAILKRGGVGDWGMFVQVFGRPIIDATWDGFDEGQRQKLLESLDIGAGGVIVRPDGTTINILESKGTNTTIHPDFMKFLNKEISKALLGTTETVESSDSSGYAQSKEHGDQDDKKHESDISFVRRILNSRFIKILESHGFNTQGGSFTVQHKEKTLSKKEAFEIDKGLKEMGLIIDDDYLYKKYNVDKPEDYEARKKLQEETSKVIDSKNQDPITKKDKEPNKKEGELNKTKDDIEEKEVKLMAKWWQGFTKLFQTAPTVTIGATNGNHHTINLGFKDSFNNLEFLQRIYNAKGSLSFDFGLFSYTSKTLLKGFKKGWDNDFIALNYAAGFEYNIDDPALLTAFEQNLFRFAGGKDLALIQQLNELFRGAKSFEEFYQLAIKQTEIFNKDWLLTEYNTAVLTGESAATYHRLMAQVDVFPYWKYTTAGDEHVRHTHHLLEGIILPANDPRWKKLFPPNGWNCRCYIVPRMRHEFDASKLTADRAKVDAYLKSPAFAKENAQGWGVNRGEIGEIFTANQQYIHKMPNMSSKLLNNLGAVNFNLKQYSQAKKVATAKMPVFENTNDKWFNALEEFNKKPIVRDYNKRPLTVDKKNFIRHTDGKKDDRVKLLNAMQETLAAPHEVWMNGSTLEDLVYVKYYKDQTIIAIADVSGNKLQLSTWFTLRESKKVIDKFRRGLLVFGNNKP